MSTAVSRLSMLLMLAIASTASAQTSSPTFSKEVARILAANCVSCHHKGGIAPMALTTYEEARPRAKSIKEVVQQRTMPPWHAASAHGEFSNDPRLSDADIAAIVAWVDAGAPRGDANDLPAMPDFSREWPLGTPDMVLQPPKPYTVAAGGGDEYRCFTMPNTSDADRWVRAVDIHPGAPSVVHHAFIWIDRGTTAAQKEGADGNPGYSCFGGPGFNATANLGAWLPGQQLSAFTGDIAYLLPAHSTLVLQVHYHHAAAAVSDQTRVGLYFSTTATTAVQSVPVLNPRFQIPAGASGFEVRASYTVPDDIDVISILPHMHLLGQSMDVTATLPDGSTRTLIRIPKYDFNWQRTYRYATPVSLPKGTRIDVLSIFDNSDNNPSNPNKPPKPVRFGEATTDEMDVAYITFVPKRPRS